MARSDVWFADLDPVVGSEQGGTRPVLIVQNDVGNRHSPTTIVAPITSQLQKAHLPTHVELHGSRYGMDRDSVILLEQLRTIDKRRLRERLAQLDRPLMLQVERALAISIGLDPAPARLGATGAEGGLMTPCPH